MRTVTPSRLMWVVAVLGLLNAPGARALDPEHGFRQVGVDVWSSLEGLPQNTVQAVQQSQDGYMWIGTQAGLVRFDGVRFVTHNSANTPGILHDDIQALAETEDGWLWVATYGGGVARLRGDVCERVDVPGLLGPNSNVRSFCVGPSGKPVDRHLRRGPLLLGRQDPAQRGHPRRLARRRRPLHRRGAGRHRVRGHLPRPAQARGRRVDPGAPALRRRARGLGPAPGRRLGPVVRHAPRAGRQAGHRVPGVRGAGGPQLGLRAGDAARPPRRAVGGHLRRRPAAAGRRQAGGHRQERLPARRLDPRHVRGPGRLPLGGHHQRRRGAPARHARSWPWTRPRACRRTTCA